jgi:glycerol-3-phosphate acyltransferase PlsX
MGSVYAKHILGIDNPRVALINVGEEEGKGNMLAKATYPLLKENNHIHFVGNAEGRDLFNDKADVMVCDGFTGNILLKLAESLYDVGRERIPGDAYFERFNFEIYGGTPVLGVAKPVIIGHGISGAVAFVNMIKLAQKMLSHQLMEKMKAELS